MTTTYVSDRVHQDVVAEHIPLAATGRCQRCRAEAPYTPLLGALRALAAAGRLPRRRLGATMPQFTGARRVA